MDQQKPKGSPKTSDEPVISFRPLSDGLGFHPFSDGLPYAPIAKSPRISGATQNAISQSTTPSTGAGAVAAGSPKMVFPQKPVQPQKSLAVPQISVPVAKGSIPIDQSLPGLGIEKEKRAQAVTQGNVEQTFGLVYLLRRMIAQLIDSGVSLALFAGIVRFGLWNEEFTPELMTNSSLLFVAACLWITFHWFLLAVQEVIFLTSIGKRLVGLRLFGSSFLVLLRSLFFLPSVGLLGIGIIWGVFDRKKRCWHDQIVEIQPINN
jgi:hypothetical protein